MNEIFKNKKELLASNPNGELILGSLNRAIDSLLPSNLIAQQVKLHEYDRLTIADNCIDLMKYDRVIVVGAGKQTSGMAQEIEKILGNRVNAGFVNVPRGANTAATNRIIQYEATHPLVSSIGVEGAKEIVSLLRKSNSKSTLVIVLISGGASALMPLPAQGITVEDKIRMNEILLKMGASIEQVNAIRKHISAIKGGQLLEYAKDSTFVSLIVSDVVGNDLSSIGSGPTSPDPTTFGQAYSTLVEHDVIDIVPSRILERLRQGIAANVPETPKDGNKIFQNVTNILLADNQYACKAMVDYVQKTYPKANVKYIGSTLQGEASKLAGHIVRTIIRKHKEIRLTQSLDPIVYIWGGESTVTVRGSGKGGRNQEQALSALIEMGKSKNEVAGRMTIAFFGTDGVDRIEAAGAMVNKKMYYDAEERDVDLQKELENNNSYHALSKLGALLRTGPTGVNVADVGIALID